MSTGTVRAFLPDLREIERHLAVPIPDRVRILRELEYDLEELKDRFMARGLSAHEARARALDALVPDAATLGELGRVHAPRYHRLTRHLSSDRLRIAERTALVVATAFVLLMGTLALLRADLLVDPSPFLWPVLGLGALQFAAIAAKAFQVWIKGDHREPGRGLNGILLLAVTTLFTGLGGMVLDLYRLFGTLEHTPELAAAMAPAWLMRESALVSVALLLALAGGLTWFVLTQWLTLLTAARREILGLDATPPTTRRTPS